MSDMQAHFDHGQPQLNGNADHEMEVQDSTTNTLPDSQNLFTCSSPTAKLYPSPTKLSMPQRCMGSHYM